MDDEGSPDAAHALELPPTLEAMVAAAAEEDLSLPEGNLRAACGETGWELEVEGVYEEVSEVVVVGLDPLSPQPLRGEAVLERTHPEGSTWSGTVSAEELGWPCEDSRLLLTSASLGVDGVLYRSALVPWGEGSREVLHDWFTEQQGGILDVRLRTEQGPDAAAASALSLHRRTMVGPVSLEPDAEGETWTGSLDLRPLGFVADINSVDLLFGVSREGELLDVDGY